MPRKKQHPAAKKDEGRKKKQKKTTEPEPEPEPKSEPEPERELELGPSLIDDDMGISFYAVAEGKEEKEADETGTESEYVPTFELPFPWCVEPSLDKSKRYKLIATVPGSEWTVWSEQKAMEYCDKSYLTAINRPEDECVDKDPYHLNHKHLLEVKEDDEFDDEEIIFERISSTIKHTDEKEQKTKEKKRQKRQKGNDSKKVTVFGDDGNELDGDDEHDDEDEEEEEDDEYDEEYDEDDEDDEEEEEDEEEDEEEEDDEYEEEEDEEDEEDEEEDEEDEDDEEDEEEEEPPPPPPSRRRGQASSGYKRKR